MRGTLKRIAREFKILWLQSKLKLIHNTDKQIETIEQIVDHLKEL